MDFWFKIFPEIGHSQPELNQWWFPFCILQWDYTSSCHQRTEYTGLLEILFSFCFWSLWSKLQFSNMEELRLQPPSSQSHSQILLRRTSLIAKNLLPKLDLIFCLITQLKNYIINSASCDFLQKPDYLTYFCGHEKSSNRIRQMFLE